MYSTHSITHKRQNRVTHSDTHSDTVLTQRHLSTKVLHTTGQNWLERMVLTGTIVRLGKTFPRTGKLVAGKLTLDIWPWECIGGRWWLANS